MSSASVLCPTCSRCRNTKWGCPFHFISYFTASRRQPLESLSPCAAKSMRDRPVDPPVGWCRHSIKFAFRGPWRLCLILATTRLQRPIKSNKDHVPRRLANIQEGHDQGLYGVNSSVIQKPLVSCLVVVGRTSHKPQSAQRANISFHSGHTGFRSLFSKRGHSTPSESQPTSGRSSSTDSNLRSSIVMLVIEKVIPLSAKLSLISPDHRFLPPI